MEGDITCAIQASGAVTCWGGAFTTPRRVAGWSDIAKLVFTRNALCGLHRDGRVDCGRTDGDAVRGDAGPIEVHELQGVTAAVDLVTYDDTVCVRERAGDIGCWIDRDASRATRMGFRGATTLWMGQWDAPEYQNAGSLYACALARGRLFCADLISERPVGEHDAPGGASPGLQFTSPRVFRRFAGITEPLVRGTNPGRNGRICVKAARGPALCGTLDDPGGAPTDPEKEPELPESCTQRDGAIACGFPGGPGTVHLDHVTQLASWGCHACAIHGAGAVACWGSDEECELGRGGCDRRAELVPARGLHDAVGLAKGVDERTVFALRANGQLASWGHGWRASAAVPTTFSSVTDAVQLVSSDGFACVRRRGGRVACWGRPGAEVFAHEVPTDVAGLVGITHLSATDQGIVARTADGTLLHLGDPQLGASSAAVPRPIGGAEHADAVAVAGQWICTLDRGRVRCRIETPRWSTPAIDIADAAVEIAARGRSSRDSVPDVLPLADPPDSLGSWLAVRLADGRALSVDLHLERGKPTATIQPLTTRARSLLVSGTGVCARGPGAVVCAGTSPDDPPLDLPRAFDEAEALLLRPVPCALQRDHQVICLAGNVSTALRGTGQGWSSVPVPIALQ